MQIYVGLLIIYIWVNLLSFNPRRAQFLFLSINLVLYHLHLLALKLRTNRRLCAEPSWILLQLSWEKIENILSGFLFSFGVCYRKGERENQNTTRIYPFPILTWGDNWILNLVKWTLRRHQQIRGPQHRKICQKEIYFENIINNINKISLCENIFKIVLTSYLYEYCVNTTLSPVCRLHYP